MKTKIVYAPVCFLLSTSLYGQVRDTIIIYDHIAIYDTVVVYDTVLVYDTASIQDSDDVERTQVKPFFNKNESSPNSILALDTTTNEAYLMLYNKTDTATISINRIILSENNKHLDTMKKEILVLAVSALLAQSTLAQQTDATITTSKSLYTIQTVVFQKKDSQKTYEVTLPAENGIQMKDRKAKMEWIVGTWQHVPSIITNINDSIVTVKFQKRMDLKAIREFNKKRKEIRKDRTLSTVEKEDRYFELAYTESVSVPIDSIESIRFSKFNGKNKKFYNSTFKIGFNEYLKRTNVVSTISIAPLYIELILIASTSLSFPAVAVVGLGACSASFLINSFVLTKKINFKKWELKQ